MADPRTEPYRLFFPVAMATGAVGIAAWGIALAGWVPAPLAGPAAHARLMLWGVLGGAVLGFLGTAYPRQNGGAPVTPAVTAAALAVHTLFVCLLVGAWWVPALEVPARATGGALWTAAALWAARIARPSLQRKWDPTTAGAPLALAAAAVGAALPLSSRVAPLIGVHAFLVPLAVLLLDRLLPFFSSKRVEGYAGGRRPGLLPALAFGITMRLAGGPTLAGLADLLLAVVIMRHWLGTRPDQGLRVPLVAVLHLGVAWLVVGYAVEGALWLTAGAAPPAALHLLTVGGLTTLVLSIAIRVTRGHADRPLVLGIDGAVLIGLVQVAAVCRAAALLVPEQILLVHTVPAVLLGLAFAGWMLRLTPLVRPTPLSFLSGK